MIALFNLCDCVSGADILSVTMLAMPVCQLEILTRSQHDSFPSLSCVYILQHAVRALGSLAAYDEAAVLINTLKGIPTVLALCKSTNDTVLAWFLCNLPVLRAVCCSIPRKFFVALIFAAGSLRDRCHR